MSPSHWQSVARISEQLGIHVSTHYKWMNSWLFQGEVGPASEEDPEGWTATDMFTLVLATVGLKVTVFSACSRERGLFPEQVQR